MGGLVKVGPARKAKKVKQCASGRCHYCNCRFTTSGPQMRTKDHRIPKARGGRNHPSNYVDCCLRCNNDKGMMTEIEYREYLRTGRKPLGWNGDTRYSLIGGPANHFSGVIEDAD